jgi:hypothetical protein
LLITLTSSNAGSSTLIDVYFFSNTNSYNDRSRTSITFLPNSHLPPIERTLLESVIEFRNVIELDMWFPSESIERLSLSDLAKSVTPQSRNSKEFGTSPLSQKRKKRNSPTEEDQPLLGKMRSYFNKLPPLSSIFNTTPPPPPPNRLTRSASLHLLFAVPPSDYMNDLINHLPYEILVHIFKFLPVDDVLPCAQVCHRTWQVANLDIVWRDLMAVRAEREREEHDKWHKYIPPTYAPCAELPYSSSPFDVQIPTYTSSGDLNTDSICDSRSSRSSRCALTQTID